MPRSVQAPTPTPLDQFLQLNQELESITLSPLTLEALDHAVQHIGVSAPDAQWGELGSALEGGSLTPDRIESLLGDTNPIEVIFERFFSVELDGTIEEETRIGIRQELEFEEGVPEGLDDDLIEVAVNSCGTSLAFKKHQGVLTAAEAWQFLEYAHPIPPEKIDSAGARTEIAEGVTDVCVAAGVEVRVESRSDIKTEVPDDEFEALIKGTKHLKLQNLWVPYAISVGSADGIPWHHLHRIFRAISEPNLDTLITSGFLRLAEDYVTDGEFAKDDMGCLIGKMPSRLIFTYGTTSSLNIRFNVPANDDDLEDELTGGNENLDYNGERAELSSEDLDIDLLDSEAESETADQEDRNSQIESISFCPVRHFEIEGFKVRSIYTALRIDAGQILEFDEHTALYCTPYEKVDDWETTVVLNFVIPPVDNGDQVAEAWKVVRSIVALNPRDIEKRMARYLLTRPAEESKAAVQFGNILVHFKRPYVHDLDLD